MAKCSSSITITIVNDGETGNGISSITYTYATSTTQTAPSSVTGTTIPTLSSTNKYLWQKEVISYTDGTNKTTTALIGVYGDKGDTGSKGDKGDTGATGATGATGNGISSIKYYYAATSTQSEPSSVTGTTIPTLSSTNKYLWQKEVISYTNGTNKTTTALIGVYGDKGDTGAKGDKGDTGATGATGPQGNKGDKGDTGATGATGATGNGISSIKYYYATSTTQTAPSSVTGTTIPTLSSTNKYLWQKEVISYTDGTNKTTTALIGVYGDKGDTGATGATGAKGDKGDTGATGPQGPQGEKGDTGATGPQGNKGDKGDKGDTGATGATGPQGLQGDKGDKGDAAWSYVTLTSGYDLNNCFTKDTIYVSTSTSICNSLLNKPTGFVAGEVRVEVQWCGGNSYVIQKLYCKSGSTTKSFYRAKSGSIVGDWVEMGAKGEKGDTGATGPQGPKGDTGATGATGPQGDKGDKGDRGDTGNTGPTGPQGPQGPQGNAGTPAYVWRFSPSSETYYRDRRSTYSQTISLTADVQGYSYNPSWTTTGGTLSASTGSSVSLTIPFDNSVNEITVTMSYANPALTYNLTFSVIDITAYGHDYGILDSAPSSPTPIFETDKPTDSYTNSSNGITYEYRASGWVASEDASKLVNGLKKLTEASPAIDLSTISNANTVSFFTKIIAQKIYADTIKAVQGFFDSITVTGNSFFYGTIKSSAFSTTLQNTTPSSTTTLSLGNTSYWNWDTFKAVLKSHYSSGAYTSVSGTYSQIRIGTSRIALPYGQQNGVTVITTSSKSRSTNAFPRTQRVAITAETSGGTGSQGLLLIEIKVGGSVVGNIGSGGGTLTVNVPKGSAITATGITSGTLQWSAVLSYFDVPSDFPDACFFDSSGIVHTYEGYVSGSLTVDSYTPSPIVYKWAGMSSASGGGETTSSSKASIVDENASINISNKQIVYASWTSATRLKLTFSDYTEVTLDSSKYYRSLSGSFSLLTASDAVVSATITPKAGTNTIGASGNPFNEGHFNTVNAPTVNSTNITGNVNSSGTTNKVYGAVFN